MWFFPLLDLLFRLTEYILRYTLYLLLLCLTFWCSHTAKWSKKQTNMEASNCHGKWQALYFGGFQKFQRETQARCAVWFSMTKTVVCSSHTVIPSSLRQDESCRKKTLHLTDSSPLRQSCRVYTACPCGSRSSWSAVHHLSFTSLALTPVSFGALVSSLSVWHWVKLNDAGTQLADWNKHRQRRKRRGERETPSDMHIGSEQSAVRC